jgi:hypothetical protein
VELMAHLGMKPRTIAIGKKEQNGTVEVAIPGDSLRL